MKQSRSEGKFEVISSSQVSEDFWRDDDQITDLAANEFDSNDDLPPAEKVRLLQSYIDKLETELTAARQAYEKLWQIFFSKKSEEES